MSTVEVKGLRELGEALKGFGEKLGKKYLAKATRDAAAVIRDDAIPRAPFLTGALREAIAIIKRRSDDQNTAHYSVGVRRIKLNKKLRRVLQKISKTQGHTVNIDGDAFYWRYLEFGTSKMKARPFLRPAFESKKDIALAKFQSSLADGVAKATAESVK